MNKREHLWTILQEECAELIQVVSKIKRFGIVNTNPTLKKLNVEILNDELNDILGVIDSLVDEGIPIVIDTRKIEAKKEKIKHFLEVSREKKTLR